jgi:hypothetical protein
MPGPTAGYPEADAARVAGALSIAYIVAIAGEVLHTFPLDFLDLLLVFTIASANGLRPEGAARRKGAVGPLPERLGISRNAVSRALNVPLETVRRRIGVLLEKKVLKEQFDGLVFANENPLGIGNNTKLQTANVELLRQLFRGLKAAGIKLD